MKISVDIPDPMNMEKVLDKAFERIEQRLRKFDSKEERNQERLHTLIKELAGQPKDIVRIFEKALNNLSKKDSISSSDISGLRSDLTKSIDRLESSLNKQWSQLGSKLGTKTHTTRIITKQPDKISVKMPDKFMQRMDKLEEAILKARPRTFAVMG